MAFEELDRQLITAPRTMPDDDFAALLDAWLCAAGDIIAAPADSHLGLAGKLRVLARLLEELEGSELSERELAMFEAIAADVKRLAAVQAWERRRLRKLIL
jgi:hypothetical protein